MTLLTRPMLAASVDDVKRIEFPVICTPKIDGIRCLKINGNIVTRSFKPLPNTKVRVILQKILPNGADGELICGNFQNTTSIFMSRDAPVSAFTYYWFDYTQKPSQPYEERLEYIKNYECEDIEGVTIIKLLGTLIKSLEDLRIFEEECLRKGFEGVIIRAIRGLYKCNRSTIREGYMLKLKRFKDAEAKIIGWTELEHNENSTIVNELGLARRSTHKENMKKSGLLGSLVVTGGGIEFSIGSGFTHEQRTTFWQQRHQIIGKIVKFKYFEQGVKVAPRFPIFMGFRSSLDLDEYPQT